MNCIAYRKGYKYQIVSEYEVTIPILPVHDIDTQNFMRGSLVHDALYQLMRERHL